MTSKYVSCPMGSSLFDCANDLIRGRNVFFTGTPCQIYALKSYLSAKHISEEKLLTADVFCHGVPQKRYWEQYLREQFPNEEINRVNFRHKKPSWTAFSLQVTTNKRTYSSPLFNDPYMVAFLKNYILEERCYSCSFKGERHVSDFSMGDFWGGNAYYPEFLNPQGTSLIVIRSNAATVLGILNNECRVKEVDLGLALFLNPAYSVSPKRPSDMDCFETEIKKRGFLYAVSHISNDLLNGHKCLKTIANAFFVKRPKSFGKKYDVGIITDYGYSNFGNRLQNYALRSVLEKAGFRSANLSSTAFFRYAGGSLASDLIALFKGPRRLIRKAKIKMACRKSGEITFPFVFNANHKKNLSSLPNVILGSDQIWNGEYNHSLLPFNLGVFCDNNENQNIISYAASFGNDRVSAADLPLFRSAFSNMTAIGLRELGGVRLVKALGFEGKLNLDPTLLLDKRDWKLAVKRFSTKRPPKKSYCLKYILSPEIANTKSLFGNKTPETMIDVLEPKSPYFLINHFDFLRLIEGADYVYTDSFHALVFSLIFGKKIMIKKREGMEGRISSLLSLLGVPEQFDRIIDCKSIDLSLLSSIKDESITFLVKNLTTHHG